jgi:hypothetical protein
MLDTVRIITKEFELRENNKFQVRTIIDLSTGELLSEKVFCNEPHFNVDIRPDDTLYLKTSLPKLIYGSSLYEIKEQDLERCVDAIERKLDYTGVTIDKSAVSESELSRVDFCRNLKVEHNLMDYIVLLSKYRISRRDKLEYKKETVAFHNGSQDLVFYNKLRETKQDKSIEQEIRDMLKGQQENILRIESRLKGKRVVDRELKRIDKKFNNVFSFELCKNRLIGEMDKLTNNDDSTQLELNFQENSNLLTHIKSKKERNIFLEFLSIKGLDRFLIEFQYDFQMIKEFLELHFKKRQVYTILQYLKEKQELLLKPEQRALLDEIRQKIQLAA